MPLSLVKVCYTALSRMPSTHQRQDPLDNQTTIPGSCLRAFKAIMISLSFLELMRAKLTSHHIQTMRKLLSTVICSRTQLDNRINFSHLNTISKAPAQRAVPLV